MTLQHTDNSHSNSNSNEQKPALESSKASVEAMSDAGMTATYSPEDNKIRMRSVSRLPRDLYDRVKAAGFQWAPKQELFVAPAWTPAREDLMFALCGEIGDEDTSLIERAEERAERFGDYSDKRASEAGRARDAVSQICEHIPLGQPILVGHHSEARARRDAKKIENGMRRAVNLWNTSEYWKRRAAGAVRLAKYKERPDVRARRISRIEADKRKQEREVSTSEKFLKGWSKPDLSLKLATYIANFDHTSIRLEGETFGRSLWSLLNDEKITPEEAAKVAIKKHTAIIAHAKRWIAHADLRLVYERAMLEEAGGLPADKFEIEIGGMVQVGSEWVTVVRINNKDGRTVSVTTNARYGRVCPIELVKDYRPPTAADVEAVKASKELGPVVNYDGEGFHHMTAAEFKAMHRDYKATKKMAATATAGAHRCRWIYRVGRSARVYLTDAKEVREPAPPAVVPPRLKRETVARQSAPAVHTPKEPTAFDAMADQLRAGVQTVNAPQLFPTPATVAARMVELADLQAGDLIREPSAGTGALLDAVEASGVPVRVIATEINHGLADQLARRHSGAQVFAADFLDLNPEHHEKAEKILMNPPFANAIDIEHIQHARKFLKPGGVLVAICASGPRQEAALRPQVEASGGIWEPLPDRTFAPATNVRTVLLTLHA